MDTSIDRRTVVGTMASSQDSCEKRASTRETACIAAPLTSCLSSHDRPLLGFLLLCALFCKMLSMSTQSFFFGVMSSDDGGGSDEAAEFFDFVTSTFPATADRWILYDTESDFEDIITASSYSQESPSDDVIGLSAGIVFSSGSPAWAYTVRRTERVLLM